MGDHEFILFFYGLAKLNNDPWLAAAVLLGM